jgi:Mitochondrial branched-chain alpha-ketoacid dehydrogenase kinase
MFPRVAHKQLLRQSLWQSAQVTRNVRASSMLGTRLAGLADSHTSRTKVRTISQTRPASADHISTALTDDVSEIVKKLASMPQTSVSLQALMRTGRGEFLHKTFDDMENVDRHSATDLVLIQVASFLRRELPIRLAHRIHDLEGAPVMRDMSSVKDVKELYVKSMMELAEFDEKITTSEQEEAFSKLVEKIYERHGSVLVRKLF